MYDDSNSTIKDAFQEPRKKFWLRSRKRTKSDAISVSSMDISIESDMGKKKKRRRITEVASSIFSSSTLGSKQGNTLHRSFTVQPNTTDLSFGDNETDTGTLKKKHKEKIENTNNFTLKSWVLDVAKTSTKDRPNYALSKKEVKRQEAIYELYCGENVLVNDLSVLKDFYYEPLVPTGIFNSDELNTLFGGVTHLIEIHNRLRNELVDLRDQYGYTETVGSTILNWIPTLTKPYLERCRTQIWAKHLLDEKRLTNKRFQSFLKKRLESPHSIDLWTYIDVARSRIVKYPLLIKEMLRHTATTHTDYTSLKEAYDLISNLLIDIDNIMGNAECKLAQSKINVKLDYDSTKCIENATELITQGQLKDTRGMKVQCFLFDTGFAITRGTRSVNKRYNLSFPVIPKEQICISADETSDTNGGFKIGDHVLATEDGHGKRHWIDSFNKINKTNINSLETAIDINEKENQQMSTPLKSRSTRSSMNKINENHFSLTLKRSFLKQKRNSTGIV
ncbi:Rho guanine nucleotide exchange factor 3 [Habropoda laboriosa]|uniref:Rho guanine nucleotide exchange factor 3 n=1 Tax=Habropoda laboriosa TaxID=597456 RepID=A0A0L7RBG1_9HYME|nr:PREDICTED: rho guanine nucleotide exchange factor 3-like [Habropoda laboriosa]KOC68204.1 Rho guanine nucleotide exchange factor 3 [Habropoda laboriosa]